MFDAVDWDALAADVIANFEATGQWFVSGASPLPPQVDWDALAAQVQANFAATGQWFVGETPPPSPPPPQVDWDALAAQVLANYEATGQWFVGEIPKPAPVPSSASYLVFSQQSLSPGTRDLWQPQGLVGDTDGSVPGMVDGYPAVVPLSAFNAFDGTEHVDTTWSIFGYASDASAPNGTQLSSLLLELQQSTAEPGGFHRGAVLAGPAGTPENPYVTVNEGAEIGIGTLVIGLAEADWGGIRNIELLERQPPSLDIVTVANFVDVRLKFIPTEAAGFAAEARVSNAKSGEVDASALPDSFSLLLSLTSDGPQGDNTFVIKGSERGPDYIGIAAGSWGQGGAAETRLDQLTDLVNDGSNSKVLAYLGAGHSVLDASRTHAMLEVFGGPDTTGTGVTPGFSTALAEPGLPGTAIFGGYVIKANLFYAGLTLGEEVPVILHSPGSGEVEAVGRAVMATRSSSMIPEVALQVSAPVSFTSVEVKGDGPPPFIPTGVGLTIASANFAPPTVIGPPLGLGGAVTDPGDGALIVASQGADIIHYRGGSEGGLAIQGFDTAFDRILLEGITPEQVRIYEFTEHPNTPEGRGATLIAFDDPFSGAPLHSLIYLPCASGLTLGDEVLIA